RGRRSATGSYRWFKTGAAPIRDAEGAITRWYGSSTDIDQLKRAEERLAAVLTSVGDAFIELDKNRAVIAMNPVAEHLLGLASSDVTGRRLSDSAPELRELSEQLSRAPI